METITVRYRNWRGEVRLRNLVPLRLWHGSTEWHPEPQWLLTCRDAETGAEKDFALLGFLGPEE